VQKGNELSKLQTCTHACPPSLVSHHELTAGARHSLRHPIQASIGQSRNDRPACLLYMTTLWRANVRVSQLPNSHWPRRSPPHTKKTRPIPMRNPFRGAAPDPGSCSRRLGSIRT